MSGSTDSQSLKWQQEKFEVDVEHRDDGSIIMTPRGQLAEVPRRVTDRLEHWAATAPDRPFVSQRDARGAWRTLSYAQTLTSVRQIGAALLRRSLSAERPIAIMSGNSIEHLLLALAAMHVGVPYAPISPSYSLVSEDLNKLRHVLQLLTPGLVAAFGSDPFARALALAASTQAEIVTDAPSGSGFTPWSELLQTPAGPEVATAFGRLQTGDTAKFLLTSGSTGLPKAVITTHRMLNVNQQMLLQVLPFLRTEPPVLVDWLPWNHTFGGSHNVGLVLFNGGSLYIDDGKPTPRGFEHTVRNLKDVSPTVYFNVPKGFEMLAERMAVDDELRGRFYRRLRAYFFAGAGLSQHTWDALDEQAIRSRGARLPMLAGLGATETAPSVTFTSPDTGRASVIGLPPVGNTIKLSPVGDKLELRVLGDNVMPGYWRDSAQTRAAFDEEGYYRLGDAVRLLDPERPENGLLFDGRISEDFKLNSGTWVSVGPLRASLLEALAPLALDVVIAGLNRDFVAVLIFPNVSACQQNLPQLGQATAEQLTTDRQLLDDLRDRLKRHAAQSRGSSTRVQRALLLNSPPSLDGGEITDKGSINQRAVLQRRAGEVDALYATEPASHVIRIA